MPLVGLFDMDGTLFDHDQAVLRDLEKIRSDNEPKITELHNSDDLPWLKARIDLIRYFADKLTSEGTNVREIPDGVEFDHDFDGVATL